MRLICFTISFADTIKVQEASNQATKIVGSHEGLFYGISICTQKKKKDTMWLTL